MNVYQNNVRKYEDRVARLDRTLGWLSTLRLTVFVLFAIIITVLANERLGTMLLVALPFFVLGFSVLIKRFNRVAYQKRHATHLKDINQEELQRLDNDLSSFPQGESFVDRDHAYVSDLDVFGSHSLFQLLNRTTTESGSICLAEWLSNPASKDLVAVRQQAIKELSADLDWRQNFQASGRPHQNSKQAFSGLLTWVNKPEQLLPRKTRHLAIAIPLSLLSTSAMAYFLTLLFTPDWFLGMIPLIVSLLINYLVLRRVLPIAEDIIDDTRSNQQTLAGYQALIAEIESAMFQATRLQNLQRVFRVNGFSAVREIKRLKLIFDLGDARRNAFYSFLNILWFLDIYWILLTEKWKSQNRPHLEEWATCIGEFETLVSIAGFHYSNPSFVFPQIDEQPYAIRFERVGHPLIHQQHRVCNDFDSKGRGRITMITGSNMSGKSTFLRTIGINLVLAFMGGPCCAKAAQVSIMTIFTSMRTMDNLQEGRSSFYAELKRIEQLLHLIGRGQPVFFLLDEMFKGTNSKDRHQGGVSLIKQISASNTSGIVSTHDLELAQLASTLEIGNNYHFYSEIKEGELSFNYQLTQGICGDQNASELMKRSGIKIVPDPK